MSNITNTMNSNENNISFSKYHSIPCYLSPNHFYCQQSDFKKIYKGIILGIEEYIDEIGNLDYQFYPEYLEWKIKYSYNSDIFNINVVVYWNDIVKDYCIEMNKKTSYYNFNSKFSFIKLYENIRKCILGENYIPLSVKPCRTFLPPPMKICSKNSIVSRNVIQENFLISINRIIQLCEDMYYDVRLNGITSLCNIVKNNNVLLLLPDCITNIVRVLKLLLEDELFYIREFAMNALFDFIKLQEYVRQFQQNEYLSLLVKLIDDIEPSLDTNSYRRKAIYIADILDR